MVPLSQILLLYLLVLESLALLLALLDLEILVLLSDLVPQTAPLSQIPQVSHLIQQVP